MEEFEGLAGSADSEGRLSRVISRVGQSVAVPGDSEDQRLQKAVMVTSVYFICFGGLFWGTIYLVLEMWAAASIPLAYTVLSLLNIANLYRSRNDRFFLHSQLTLILLLPFFLQWAAGGFVPSGAVMLWAILSPVGALMFHGVRESLGWFVAYIVLTVASVTLEGQLTLGASAQVSEGVRAAFFASNVILVSSILFLLLRYFVSATAEAKRLSDNLVLSMLPEPIAERIKAGESPIADRFDDVSVVYADIVNFTQLADSLTPEDLVHLLNEIYGEFDRLAGELSMEKIRTVGDAYIVVAGLPEPLDGHPLVATEMAVRMREYLRSRPESGHPVEMRMGIHCGPVIAGVLGTTKPNYEVWGDTVNVASRMESTGVPGEIQVSQAVFEAAGDLYGFISCGSMEIKGKGAMDTYLLISRAKVAPQEA